MAATPALVMQGYLEAAVWLLAPGLGDLGKLGLVGALVGGVALVPCDIADFTPRVLGVAIAPAQANVKSFDAHGGPVSRVKGRRLGRASVGPRCGGSGMAIDFAGW